MANSIRNVSCVLILLISLTTLSCEAGDSPGNQVSQGGYNFYPSISPNGKFIAYLHEVDNVLGSVGHLWLYDITTKERRNISDVEQYELFDSYPTWTNDSKEIIFGTDTVIYSYNIITDHQRVLFSTSSEEASFFAPNLSHDGKLLAFNSLIEPDSIVYLGVWVWEHQGQKVYQLHDMEYNPLSEIVTFHPLWTLDDSKVVTVSPPTEKKPQISINVIDVTTRVVDVISDDVYHTFIKVANENVYFTRREGDTVGLYLYNYATKRESKIVENLDSFFDVASADDNSYRIVFSRNDSLYIWGSGQTEPLSKKGHNPQVRDGILIYEVSFGSDDSLQNVIVMNNL